MKQINKLLLNAYNKIKAQWARGVARGGQCHPRMKHSYPSCHLCYGKLDHSQSVIFNKISIVLM